MTLDSMLSVYHMYHPNPHKTKSDINIVTVTLYLMCDHDICYAFGARPGHVKCQGYNSTALKPFSSLDMHVCETLKNTVIALMHQFLVSHLDCVLIF